MVVRLSSMYVWIHNKKYMQREYPRVSYVFFFLFSELSRLPI